MMLLTSKQKQETKDLKSLAEKSTSLKKTKSQKYSYSFKDNHNKPPFNLTHQSRSLFRPTYTQNTMTKDNISILNTDCMEYMKGVPDKYFDLALIEPPYGLNEKLTSGGTWAEKWKDKGTEDRIHVCQKPIKLYEWILHNYAKPTDKILDTHLGSGSSAIAAHRFGIAEFIGCELDKEYFNMSVKRFKEQTAQQGIQF